MIEEPLFRSYCFVNIAENDRANVFAVPGVVRYLFWLKKPAIVKGSEIEMIKLMLNEVDHDLITVNSFRPGDRLIIGSGCFLDTTGKVIRQQGKIVSVQLDSLQIVLKVDLSRTIVSK